MTKRIIYITLIFLSKFSLYSQNIEISRDTAYFDQDWHKTIYLEDAKYARVYKRDLQGMIAGTVRNFYLPSWNIQFEGKCLSDNSNILDGLCTWYYENGIIQSKTTYINGKPSKDLVHYKEDGSKVECIDTLIELQSKSQKKLHSYYNSGSSRTVYAVNTYNLKDIIVQYSIEDEESVTPMHLTASLMAYAYNLGGLMNMLSSGNTNKRGSTKNSFFITTNRDVAQYFIDTKGGLKSQEGLLFNSENSKLETIRLKIQDNISDFYICIQNNNSISAAISTLEVVGLTKVCR